MFDNSVLVFTFNDLCRQEWFYSRTFDFLFVNKFKCETRFILADFEPMIGGSVHTFVPRMLLG